MNFSLPFFYRKGTICNIVESEKCYIVYRYDLDGNPRFISKVPKSLKNYELLFENYCDDLKSYLEVNSIKYQNYKNLVSNNKFDSKLINYLMVLLVVMIGSSIPFLLNFEILGFLGMALNLLAIPVLVTTINLSVKEANIKKKNEFMGEYQEFERKYQLYCDEKAKKNNITEYKGLQIVDKVDKVIDLNLIKELKKVS